MYSLKLQGWGLKEGPTFNPCLRRGADGFPREELSIASGIRTRAIWRPRWLCLETENIDGMSQRDFWKFPSRLYTGQRECKSQPYLSYSGNEKGHEGFTNKRANERVTDEGSLLVEE